MRTPALRSCSALATALCIGLVLQVSAQGGATIPELAGKSAKERSRIADQEARDARDDAEFQRLMVAAEDLFRQGRHADALAGYERARDRRPLNVHPRVKIQDISDLIARNEAAAREAEAAASRTLPAHQEPVPEPDPVPMEAEEIPVKEKVPVVPSIQAPPASAPHGPVTPSPVEPEKPLAEAMVVQRINLALSTHEEQGYVEEQFREGNAIVIQRTLGSGANAEVYRRVIHPWGQLYHFHNGQPIDERIWKERFGDH